MDINYLPSNLHYLRTKAGLSSEELASKINDLNKDNLIINSIIERWESGDRSVSTKNLKTLSSYYGISMDTLISLNLVPQTGDTDHVDGLIEQLASGYPEDAQALKELRKLFNLSQRDIGEGIGIVCSSVCFWETGAKPLIAKNVTKLQEYFRLLKKYKPESAGLPRDSKEATEAAASEQSTVHELIESLWDDTETEAYKQAYSDHVGPAYNKIPEVTTKAVFPTYKVEETVQMLIPELKVLLELMGPGEIRIAREFATKLIMIGLREGIVNAESAVNYLGLNDTNELIQLILK